MNFTILLLIAFAMSMTTQGNMQTTDSMQTTGDSMQTSGGGAAGKVTTKPPVKSTTAPAKQSTTKPKVTTKKPGTTDDMQTTGMTTGGMETTDADTSEVVTTKAETADFTVTTTFKDMTTAKFESAKGNLTAVFAGIFGVDAGSLTLTFDEPTKAVTVTVAGISTEKANNFKATVNEANFTDNLNKKIKDAGVAGVESTGSSAKVTPNTPKPNTTKQETTAAPTGSSSALTVLAGLLALLAY